MPVRGDRRDHFEAETDIWEVFLRIAAGRKEREIDPAIAVLKTCSAEAERDAGVSVTARARLKEMLGFIEMMERFYTNAFRRRSRRSRPRSGLARRCSISFPAGGRNRRSA